MYIFGINYKQRGIIQRANTSSNISNHLSIQLLLNTDRNQPRVDYLQMILKCSIGTRLKTLGWREYSFR
jgi:hypothetical protein